MKRLFFFACLCLILSAIACNKKDEITDDDQFPAWLQTKIDELTSEQNICKYTDVTIREYQGRRYYEVYCGIWSCYHCQLFDETGKRPTWDSDGWKDFFANQKVMKVLPACPK